MSGDYVNLLADLKEGVKAEIIRIDGGFGMQQHLSSLSLKVGSVVRRVPLKHGKGPVMVEVDNNRIAIGRGIARKIIVREI